MFSNVSCSVFEYARDKWTVSFAAGGGRIRFFWNGRVSYESFNWGVGWIRGLQNAGNRGLGMRLWITHHLCAWSTWIGECGVGNVMCMEYLQEGTCFMSMDDVEHSIQLRHKYALRGKSRTGKNDPPYSSDKNSSFFCSTWNSQYERLHVHDLCVQITCSIQCSSSSMLC
jgi:hypothetical protein